MGAILSPIADPILQHIAADRTEAQTAFAAHRGFGFCESGPDRYLL
jgi:hypothetical protein